MRPAFMWRISVLCCRLAAVVSVSTLIVISTASPAASPRAAFDNEPHDFRADAERLDSSALAGRVDVVNLESPFDHVALAALDDGVARLTTTTPAFGTVDTWRWEIHGGGGIEVKNDDNVEIGAGASLSYFILENVSLNMALNGWQFQQVGQNANGINFNLFFRWHALDYETWSIFIEGGAGALYTTSDVPDGDGSSFNFTPLGGVGASFDIGNDVRLLTGVRWHHISNARLYEPNPGRDSIILWAGVSFPF
ncbi:MAG: acyloxyacyl hydrolase [Phycisphaerales bacterium]|nr:acyloxyacyl hydrolase [Phycisphaerales bacterium]